MEQMVKAPRTLLATGAVPKTLFKNLNVLNLKEGISNIIQRAAVLGPCHIVSRFFSL
jgi:hypothetical protein